MTQETWDQIEQLWQQACKLPASQREAFVHQTAVKDERVRREVLAMLQQDARSEDFLETPAIEDEARHLATEKLNAPTIAMQGQRFGAYEIIAELGSGGMGTVYLARDLNLQREVALKALPDLFANDRDRVQRFQREAEMLARVQHVNVATLFDYDRASAGGPRFLVMEYVPGETLAERLARGALTAQEAAPLFRQIATALQAAHAQGIIHRDLKPANIKITPDGIVKVLDFGLAKAARKTTPTANSSLGDFTGTPTQLQTLTQPHMILGTPGYMSPEQVRGEKDLDQRTDWWAFGCMLYEALSGKNPFRANTAADTQAAILHKEPDWKTLPATTPPALVKLIHQCLAKDLATRVRKAADVLPWLEKIKAPSRLSLTVLRLRRRAPQLAIAAACVVLLLGLYIGYRALQPPPRTVLAVVAAPDVRPCEPGQSEAIARLVQDKLKDWRGVQLAATPTSERSQPFLMIDADLTQAALTAEATTILKVAAVNCTNGQSGIQYSLTSKQGQTLATGTATDLGQMLLSVAGSLRLQGDTTRLQASEMDLPYYRAVALLEHYVNPQSIREAIALLHQLETTDETNINRTKAALGWGYYLQDYLAQWFPEKDAKWDGSDREKALSYCDQATNDPTKNPDVLLMCGKVSTSLGNFTKAIASFNEVLRQRTNDSETLLALAKAYEFSGDVKKAEETYLRAVALRPAYWDVYNQLGSFYFDQGEFQQAEEHWRRVTELLDLNPSGFNNLASALLYQGEFDRALRTYQDALSRKKMPVIYHNMGTAYLYAGDCGQALEAFRKGQELDAEDAEFWGASGDALSCTAPFTPPANKAYEQAIERLQKSDQPNTADSLSLLAEWYARTGKKLLALQKIASALQLEPDNLNCVVSAVKVYKITDEPDKLLTQLTKAVQNRKSLFEVKHDPLLKELLQQEKYRQLLER